MFHFPFFISFYFLIFHFQFVISHFHFSFSFFRFSFSVCGIGPGDVHARMLTRLTRVEVRAATPDLRVWGRGGSA